MSADTKSPELEKLRKDPLVKASYQVHVAKMEKKGKTPMSFDFFVSMWNTWRRADKTPKTA